jgi:endonuclease I
MKKLITAILFTLTIIGIVGCNNTNTETQTTEQTSTVEETSEAPTTTEIPTTTERPSTTIVTTVERTTITELPSTTETPTTTTEEPTTILTTTEVQTTAAEVVGMSYELLDRFYEIDEAFDESAIILTAHYSDETTEIIDTTDFRVRGFSSELPGQKEAFIQYGSFIVEFSYIVLESFAFEIDNLYYEDAINLQGDLLKVALNTIINENFNPLLYADARDILQVSDEDPNNPDNIILVYTRESVVSTWDCVGTDCTWNREHVWPQSRLGVRVGYGDDDFPSKATDMHNLKPSDPDENALRSNDYFDYTGTNDTYEPHDDVKGDIARILFYMATMYSDLTLNNDPDSNSSEKTMGILDILLEWNELDPVDDFERNRNNVLFSYQGNRNPFIDYPEFAELIWGSNE